MGVIESRWVGGISCDRRGCPTRYLLPELVWGYGAEYRQLEADVFAAGWVKRLGRSATWHCPGEHADQARRCIKGKYGACSRWCPVHKDGRIVTEASR